MDIDKNYQEALDYIYSFVDYSLTRSLSYSPERLNLERMDILLARLGNPHRQYPVVHVAGTKGKGSVSAMIASALRAAGYRTGFYTSPHLQDFCERIQINNEMVSHLDLVSLVDALKTHVEVVKTPTTFELTTALAFMYFAQHPVDIAVIEVGLGGRWDSTNLVLPEVSVITSLSYDHMAVLGSTLAEIAGEKAGIIKEGRPVVSSPQKEEARLVIEAVARERGSAVWQAGKDMLFAPHEHSLDGQSLWVWPAQDQAEADEFFRSDGARGKAPELLTTPLLGRHQVENAATAYTALQVLNGRGFNASREAIKAGFASVIWPGRFDILARHPFVVVDSAHNRDSALRLHQAMEEYFPGRPVVMVFGVSEDKDIRGMFSELLPGVQQVIMTQSQHPRAMDAGKLAELAEPFQKPTKAIPAVENALAFALEQVAENGVVLVTGSLFVAAAARAVWSEVINEK